MLAKVDSREQMHSSNMRELETTITEVVGLARSFCLPLIYVRRKGPLEAQRQRHWAWERSSFQRTDTSSFSQFSLFLVVLLLRFYSVFNLFSPGFASWRDERVRWLHCQGVWLWYRRPRGFGIDATARASARSARGHRGARDTLNKIWKNQINAACQNVRWPYEAQYDIRSQFILVLVCLWDLFPCRTRLPRHWQILLKLEITLRIVILVVKVQLHCRSTKLVCTVVRKTTLPYLAYFDTSLNWPGPSSLQFQMGRVIMSRFKIILWNCGTVIKPYPIRLFYSLDGRVNSEVGHSQVQLPCSHVFPSKLWHQVMPCLVLKKHIWQLPQRRQKISHWQRQETV